MDSDSEIDLDVSAGSNFNDEDDEDMKNGDKFYQDFTGSELEGIKKREDDAGFRHHLVKEKPSLASRFKQAVWRFSTDETSSIPARLFYFFIIIMIIFSVVVFIVQSWPSYQTDDQTKWFLIETAIVAVFTFEYIIRLLSAPDPIKFIIHPLSIIDLISILPYFVELIIETVFNGNVPVGWIAVVRIFRLFRVFRLFKLGRFLTGIQAITYAAYKSAPSVLFLLFMLIVGMVIFSSFLYFAEQTEEEFDEDEELWFYTEDSDDPFSESPFQSIPHTLWWCIVTMTTVGYGDTSPITPAGKAVAGFTMLLGILLLAFPVGVLSTKFGEALVDILDKKETTVYVTPRSDFIVDKKLETIENNIKDFANNLESIRDSFNTISATHKHMAKHIDRLMMEF